MMYKKVDGFFNDFYFYNNIKKIVWSGNMVKNNVFRGYIKQNATLYDGQIIEICYWYKNGLIMYDVSIDKSRYDAEYGIPFEEYVGRIGIYTENLEIINGSRWKYLGQKGIQEKDCYRLQFVLEDFIKEKNVARKAQ